MEGDRDKKANLIFEKAMEHYNRQDYEEALKLFELSQKFSFNSRTEIFISVCKNNISSGDNKKNNYQKKNTSYTNNNNTNNTNNYQRSYSSPNNSNINSNSNTNYSSKTSSESNGNSNDDTLCINLLNKKDYYDILNIPKNANQEEIKKAYKKQAIKFHPDKNHSKKAEECFKKVSEAYQILSNPEKKEFYDKYGDEQEFRNRYYQTHQHQYEDDIDPFDIFEMFFNGGTINLNRRNFRRRRQNNNQNENENQRRGKFFTLLQFIPFILILLLSNLPDLFEFFKSPPLYQFYKDYNYSQKRKTSINNIEYYIGDSFIKKYPKLKNVIESGVEENIEKDYLNFITQQCQKVINKRNEYEYYVQLGYYRYQYALQNLDLSSCYKYNELKNKIR